MFNGQIFFFNSLGSGGSTDYQKFLEGAARLSFGGGGVFNHEYRDNNFGFFVQDDWKARPNLTLNLDCAPKFGRLLRQSLPHRKLRSAGGE